MQAQVNRIDYANAINVAAPAPVSEIDSQMNSLACGLASLENGLEALRGRLSAFICEPPTGDGKCAPREQCGSQFGQVLQTQAERAHAAASRLDHLMACLRV